jgi:predicted  nucleic acid-binding Zn-ribbon protein
MSICTHCGEDFSDKRKALGINVCLECGELEAQKQTRAKSKRLAPIFNKGSYQYITEGTDPKTLGR